MTYKANFFSRNYPKGLINDLTDTNKHRLYRRIRDVAIANVNYGETVHYWVRDEDGKCVMAAWTDKGDMTVKELKELLWQYDEFKADGGHSCEDCEWYHQNDPDYPDNCEYPDSPPCNEQYNGQ